MDINDMKMYELKALIGKKFYYLHQSGIKTDRIRSIEILIDSHKLKRSNVKGSMVNRFFSDIYLSREDLIKSLENTEL